MITTTYCTNYIKAPDSTDFFYDYEFYVFYELFFSHGLNGLYGLFLRLLIARIIFSSGLYGLYGQISTTTNFSSGLYGLCGLCKILQISNS